MEVILNSHRYTVVLLTNFSGEGGGAERQLLTLAEGIDKRRFRVLVVTLAYGNSETRPMPGVEHICLNRTGKLDPFPMFRIMKILRRDHVDILQPFLSPVKADML